MQMLLDKIGCEYTMMFWQNPWYDVRPIVKPDKWKATWQDADTIIADAEKIVNIPSVTNMLNTINWSKFKGLTNHSTNNFTSYTGLWEYSISNITQHIDQWHTNDDHPNALAQHDFLCNALNIEPTLRNKATETALKYKDCDVSYDYSALIPDNLNAKFR